MNSIEGYVYCEFDSDIHADVPDPHDIGPVNAMSYELDLRCWTLRTDPQYSGELWFFTCPGRHYKVYTRAEV